MDEFFEIPVTYRGQELSFSSRVFAYGYTYKIQVDVFGEQIMFEPDEERNYRVVLNEEQLQKGAKYDIGLLKEIAHVIETVRENEGQ